MDWFIDGFMVTNGELLRYTVSTQKYMTWPALEWFSTGLSAGAE
jgi:hypothetical protein